MFSEIDGSRKAIGDVDVLYHDGLFHLFHLVLPNHDFIAHAVSTDAIHWRRVRNSIFIGDPGSWDDLMLWTMHVSPDPHKEGSWRMFYTGITRRDRGRYQRLGMSVSDDLYHWKKYPVSWEDLRGKNDPEPIKKAREAASRDAADECHAMLDDDSCFPLCPDPKYYEEDLEEARHLISFRDPYFFIYEGHHYLLAAARTNDGPIVRRGCVALMEEKAPHCFEVREPILSPGIYDDIEVPNFIQIGEQCYLIGSIREDAKIRYWHRNCECDDWQSYHDNVLMPQGNYAGRVCKDKKGWLLWCFFTMDRSDRTKDNLMPPPKRLARDKDGLLYLQTYEELSKWCLDPCNTKQIELLKPPRDAEEHSSHEDGKRWELSSTCAFQGFLFKGDYESFRLKCSISVDGMGKCGFLFRINRETHDGYYLSLDLLKGVAQLRSWGTNRDVDGEHMMNFESLQAGYWVASRSCSVEISLFTFGSYIELSIDGRIVLSLADRCFKTGAVGIYLESRKLTMSDIDMRPVKNPDQMENHLVGG